MSETQVGDAIINENEEGDYDPEWKDEEVPDAGKVDWSGCPNCGGKMELRFDTKQPWEEGEKTVWLHSWLCRHCWTSVDRTVKVPNG